MKLALRDCVHPAYRAERRCKAELNVLCPRIGKMLPL